MPPPPISSASGKGDVSVAVSDGSVELHAGGHPSATLPRLEDQQAAAELRELLFRMADALAEHSATGRSLFFLNVVKTTAVFFFFRNECLLSRTVFSRCISSCKSSQASPETSGRYSVTSDFHSEVLR